MEVDPAKDAVPMRAAESTTTAFVAAASPNTAMSFGYGAESPDQFPPTDHAPDTEPVHETDEAGWYSVTSLTFVPSSESV